MAYEIKTDGGYDFYEVASALQKACRRGDVRLAGFMALELFPRYSTYCWKRLMTISAEDCYGIITQEILALKQGFDLVNMNAKKPTGRVFISKAVILLCEAKKSRDADVLSNYIHDRKAQLKDEDIEKLIEEVRAEKPAIPEYVFDCHTRKGKMCGHTKAEFFKVEDAALVNKQPSLFDGLEL